MIVKPIRIFLGALSMVAALAVSQPIAVADVQVILTLASPPNNGNSVGSVDLSPYNLNVANPSTPTLTTLTSLICDDFNDEIVVGESWTADVFTGSAIPTDIYDSAYGLGSDNSLYSLATLTTDYQEIAYLASQLSVDPADQAALSFAIWSILDPNQPDSTITGDVASLNGTEQAAYSTFLYNASSIANTSAGADYLANLTVYQPVAGTQTEGATAPQQFLTVTTPEASSPAILALDLLALFGAVFLLRRRILSNARPSCAIALLS